MQSVMIGLLAETSLHPGASGAMGDVDLPVAREEPMGLPLVPDSGMKGAFREKCRNHAYQKAVEAKSDENQARNEARKEAEAQFGKTDEAGPVSFGDARLLLLPVRSLDRLYRWVTCPYLIERLGRDIERLGLTKQVLPPDRLSRPPATAEALSVASKTDGKHEQSGPKGGKAPRQTIFLEELDYTLVPSTELEKFVQALGKLIGHTSVADRVSEALAVVDDAAFSHIARTALPVRTHNVLDEKKASKNLFNEELLPVDTVLYCVATEIVPRSLHIVTDLLPSDDPYIRVGANETLGQGWCRASIVVPAP